MAFVGHDLNHLLLLMLPLLERCHSVIELAIGRLQLPFQHVFDLRCKFLITNTDGRDVLFLPGGWWLLSDLVELPVEFVDAPLEIFL